MLRNLNLYLLVREDVGLLIGYAVLPLLFVSGVCGKVLRFMGLSGSSCYVATICD